MSLFAYLAFHTHIRSVQIFIPGAAVVQPKIVPFPHFTVDVDHLGNNGRCTAVQVTAMQAFQIGEVTGAGTGQGTIFSGLADATDGVFGLIGRDGFQRRCDVFMGVI